MERRTLVGLGLGALAGTLIVPRALYAKAPMIRESGLAGSIFYTAESPGRWKGKEASHMPNIARDGGSIEITTRHEMDPYRHYIVKHVIFDQDLKFLAEKLFDPTKDKAVSQHDVSGLGGTLYAISLCNQHDAWLGSLEL